MPRVAELLSRPWVLRAWLLGSAALALLLFWWCLSTAAYALATVNLGTLALLIVNYTRLDAAVAAERRLRLRLEMLRAAPHQTREQMSRPIGPAGEGKRWH